jgi:hypothetical protein
VRALRLFLPQQRGAILTGLRPRGKIRSRACTRSDKRSAVAYLDGIARRLVLCPPDFTKDRVASVIEQAEVEAIAGDDLVQESA